MHKTPVNSRPETCGTDHSGCMIVNADDWGLDINTTRMIHDCLRGGSVTAVSAMVYMADSERAAELAREDAIDAGLHLNLTADFTGAGVAAAVRDRQRLVAAYLRRHKFAAILFNPRLSSAFEYVVSAQIAEFERLYGMQPLRLDGHHHMHLCANVLGQRLLPRGTIARRNFTFARYEKHIANRAYRRAIDAILARRHRLVDCLFNLAPLNINGRLARIAATASHRVVELETHPALHDEYQFLQSGGIAIHFPGVRVKCFEQLTDRATA